MAGLRALAQAAAARSEAKPHAGSGNWTSLLIAAAGVILLVLVALGWAYVVEAFVWSGVPRGTVPRRDAWPTLGAAVALLLLVWLSGRQLDVLNLLSLHAFYAARLSRAYLGAGNAARGVPWSAQPARSAADWCRSARWQPATIWPGPTTRRIGMAVRCIWSMSTSTSHATRPVATSSPIARAGT